MNQKKQYQGSKSITQVHKEKIDLHILLKLELHILDSGLEVSEMGMAFKYGLMELDMRVIIQNFLSD
jgi:hypothetical protein